MQNKNLSVSTAITDYILILIFQTKSLLGNYISNLSPGMRQIMLFC